MENTYPVMRKEKYILQNYTLSETSERENTLQQYKMKYTNMLTKIASG